MLLHLVFAVSRSFPSLTAFVFVHLRSSPLVRGVPWGCALLLTDLFPSRLPSRYSMRGAGEAVSVPWCGCSFRGVALRVLAWCPVVPLGGSFPVGAWGGAFWLVFSYGIIGRVVR